MLYLEDYLEMIEHLPQELRDRFTEMRELDLGVQNNIDKLDNNVKTFFSQAKRMRSYERANEYENIRKGYYKTLEDADEKVHLANQMHDLVERYLRRLDQELHKFKMELEADNRGITEILEKRSLELDQPQQNSSQKENRYNFSSSNGNPRGRRRDSAPVNTQRVLTIDRTAAISDLSESRVPTTNHAGSVQNPVLAPTAATAAAATATATAANLSYNLGHIGAGGTAIAAAASQAIAATQQMQQGRRTASLKASYEAINTGVHAHEFSIGKELAGAAQTAIAAIQETTKKQRKRRGSGSSSAAPVISLPSICLTRCTPPLPNLEKQEPETTKDTANVDPAADNPDWTYDPNEPRYCICNQVSYGDMVACDNTDCPFEWFHYNCVDITAPPKGKWYCPQCTSSMKRRGSRK